MDLNVPQQQPTDFPEPHVEMSGETVKHRSNSALIALIISAVLILGAAGVAGWVSYQNWSNPGGLPQDQSVTKDVKNVSWVAPEDLPVRYQKRQQNTEGSQITYYSDDAALCTITTTVSDAEHIDGATPREAVLSAVKKAGKLGITTIASQDGSEYKLKDADDNTEYPFATLILTQKVNVQGVSFKEQMNIVAFKQFGKNLASISIACKTSSWDEKKEALEGILTNFKLKTET